MEHGELHRIKRRRTPAPEPASLSPEVLSHLIGGIYDCVLEPAKWETILASVNRPLSFCGSVLGIHPLRFGTPVINVSVGMDAEWLSVGPSYSREMGEIWGGAERLQEYPLDEPIIGSHCVSPEQRRNNRYNREVLVPRGIIDAVGIAIAREPGLIGYIAFNRHSSAGKIGEAELHVMRLLAPHFRRAATISNLLDLKAVEAATFTSALEALAFGIVLVDEGLGIVHANPAAEAMLSEGEPVRSSRGALSLSSASYQAALESAVAQAATDEAALGRQGIGIPAARSSGAPAIVHVMPLTGRFVRAGLMQRAVAALFIVSPGKMPVLPTDALALLYDLTPAEARIFELVCAGKPQSAIAAQLGIGRSTVKTHLLHVFEKTGCRRQGDLLRLAQSLSLPG